MRNRALLVTRPPYACTAVVDAAPPREPPRRVYAAIERGPGRSGPALDLHPREGFMLPCVDDLMPIGEFSGRSGLSAKRLRSYAAGGLLVPAAVDSASGYRD